MTQSQTAQPTYLIVVRQMLIAQDLAETIADHDKGANIIIASTLAEAAAAIAPIARLEVAFIADAPGQFMASSLAKAIADRNGKVVLLGEEAEQVGATSRWTVLHQPFTTDAVLKLLD